MLFRSGGDSASAQNYRSSTSLGVPGVDLFDPKGRLGWCMSRVKEGMRVEEKGKRREGKRGDERLERIYGWIGKDEMDGKVRWMDR